MLEIVLSKIASVVYSGPASGVLSEPLWIWAVLLAFVVVATIVAGIALEWFEQRRPTGIRPPAHAGLPSYRNAA